MSHLAVDEVRWMDVIFNFTNSRICTDQCMKSPRTFDGSLNTSPSLASVNCGGLDALGINKYLLLWRGGISKTHLSSNTLTEAFCAH